MALCCFLLPVLCYCLSHSSFHCSRFVSHSVTAVVNECSMSCSVLCREGPQNSNEFSEQSEFLQSSLEPRVSDMPLHLHEEVVTPGFQSVGIGLQSQQIQPLLPKARDGLREGACCVAGLEGE